MIRIISALTLTVTVACAQAQEAAAPVETPPATVAAPAAVKPQEPIKLVDNPPDRHIVVKGDTLWGISGKFLKEPWRWPEIWRLNKDEIKNPHRIYPGDIIILDYVDGKPRLKVGKAVKRGKSGPLRVEPRVYSDDNPDAIPSIPPNVIEPFISKPLIIEADGLDTAPRIVASQEDRVFIGNGDTGFVAGIYDASVIDWQIYRPGKPLKDPETGEVIGYEAFYLGTAKLLQPGRPPEEQAAQEPAQQQSFSLYQHTPSTTNDGPIGEPAIVRIGNAKEEIARGDRLVPAAPPNLVSYVPRKPEGPVSGQIMSIYGGVNEAGKLSVISINRGSRDLVDPGHVVALYRKRVSYGYDDNNRRVTTVIPDERYAVAFVFRTFERISYALVMESSKPVIVGDAVKNP